MKDGLGLSALEMLTAFNALGWRYRATTEGEWRSFCPACGSYSLGLREHRDLDADVFGERGESVWLVECWCGRGCDHASVSSLLAGVVEFVKRRQPKPLRRRRVWDFARSAVDDLKAQEYVPALTGEEPRFGFVRCPFHGNGEERTPSLKLYPDGHWSCHACRLGGTVIDFGAALYGITPRGRGFHEIRRRLAEDLGVAA